VRASASREAIVNGVHRPRALRGMRLRNTQVAFFVGFFSVTRTSKAQANSLRKCHTQPGKRLENRGLIGTDARVQIRGENRHASPSGMTIIHSDQSLPRAHARSTPRLGKMGLRTWLNVIDDVMLQRWHTRHLPSDPKDVCGPDVEGKTFIVTGPTSGIGTTTAETLARLGARVILACRTVKRGQALVEQWTRDSEPGAPPLDCEVMHLDLDSLASVRAFADAFLATGRPLHCLLNNAGVFDMSGAYKKTEDGHEQHYGTNYLAPALLSLALMPALRKAGEEDPAAPARVVFVCSKLHEFCDGLALEDLAFDRRRYGARAAYAQSKLAELLFARALEKRLRGIGISSVGRDASDQGDGRRGRRNEETKTNDKRAVSRRAPGKHRHRRGAHAASVRAGGVPNHHGLDSAHPRGRRARVSVRGDERGGAARRNAGAVLPQRMRSARAVASARSTTKPPRRSGLERSRRSGWRRSRRNFHRTSKECECVWSLYVSLICQ
jgi:NAD(P)-dependent dehydrogenase (short-subunit alcohol dehydrogenase family)